jgi:soluble lytic murein transglycosylase-like protein
MKPSFFASIVMVAGIGGLAALPARAQITSYVDGRGRRIYTNLARPARQGGRSLRRRATRAPRAGLESIVRGAAERHGLDPRLVGAVVRAESGWNPAAISSKGAEGLMQLVPATAKRFGVRDVFDPAENAEGGVRYLRALLARYRGNLAKSLAAYYAGEGTVDRAAGLPNDPATRAYVRRVSRFYFSRSSDPPFPLRRFAIRRVTDAAGRVVYTNE